MLLSRGITLIQFQLQNWLSWFSSVPPFKCCHSISKHALTVFTQCCTFRQISLPLRVIQCWKFPAVYATTAVQTQAFHPRSKKINILKFLEEMAKPVAFHSDLKPQIFVVDDVAICLSLFCSKVTPVFSLYYRRQKFGESLSWRGKMSINFKKDGPNFRPRSCARKNHVWAVGALPGIASKFNFEDSVI